jgi:hypothetical protein
LNAYTRTVETNKEELIIMKLSSVLFAFGAAALLGLAAGARAEGPPAPLPKGPAGDAPALAAPAAAAAAPAEAAKPLPGSAAVVTAPTAAVPAACCAATCEPVIKKVCVPYTSVKTVTRRVYGETCEDFCVPKCPLSLGLHKGHGHGDCDACPTEDCQTECAQCEHKVRQRKYLVVKIKQCQETATSCSVECRLEEPTCRRAACEPSCLPPAGTIVTSPAPMPPAEKLSAPKNK